MRILYIINCFSLGGAEKLVMDLCEAIASQCDYVGIAALYAVGDGMEQQLVARMRTGNIHTYILNKRVGKDEISTVMQAARIARENRLDVIHGHCSVPMLIAKLAGALTGTPVVATVHNTRGYSARRERLTGWMCKRYVSICDAAETYMTEELRIPREKITRIYNAVDTARFVPAPKTKGFWKAFGLREELPVVLNIGRVAKQKNQLCLLRGLARCRDLGKPIQCVILGAYEEASPVYQELESCIRDNGLTELVKFLGQRDQIPLFLANADFFVMTSFYEGFSVSFLEAVLCGTPIVVTQLPFVEELTRIGACATVIPQDDSQALCSVLMAGTGVKPNEQVLQRFRTQFSMELFAKKHLALYLQASGKGEEG